MILSTKKDFILLQFLHFITRESGDFSDNFRRNAFQFHATRILDIALPYALLYAFFQTFLPAFLQALFYTFLHTLLHALLYTLLYALLYALFHTFPQSIAYQSVLYPHGIPEVIIPPELRIAESRLFNLPLWGLAAYARLFPSDTATKVPPFSCL